jgi:hypothetical protein
MAQHYDGVGGQVLSASAYLGSSASGNMRIGLYADNAGEPGALSGCDSPRSSAWK